MRYISNTPAQQKEMLGTIGASSIEELLSRIPPKARLSRPLAESGPQMLLHMERIDQRPVHVESQNDAGGITGHE